MPWHTDSRIFPDLMARRIALSTGINSIASSLSCPPPIQCPRLQLSNISKRYPGCLANDAIDLTIAPGEIHALLGENGAGKSTLMKIIYGVVQADAGEIFWHGQPVNLRNPAQARELGIGMVFQHFSLFETLSVAQNIALAMGPAAGSPSQLEREDSMKCRDATAWRWSRSDLCTACPSANGNGWKSFAA